MARKKFSRLFAAIVLCTCSLGALAAEPETTAESGGTNAAGLFVAVGYGGFRGWSVDGEHWTAERWSEKSEDDPNIIFGLAYRDGVFLCSGGGVGKGFILRSTDGKQWTEVVRTKWRIAPVVATPSGFLSAFDDHLQTSADGLTWEKQASAKPTTADGIGGGYFRRWAAGEKTTVFAGDYDFGNGTPRVGWLAGTKNGTTPLAVQLAASDVCGLRYGNKRFLACTKSGELLTSTDGLAFEPAGSSGEQHDDDALGYYDGRFYLRSHAGTQVSSDGKEWQVVEHPPRLPRAVSPSGVAVDCGWGGIDVAVDGKNWKKASVPVNATGITAVVYGVPAGSASKSISH